LVGGFVRPDLTQAGAAADSGGRSPGMDAVTLVRISARANRLANHRLHAALAPLSREELHAARTGFFPSLFATLHHILAVDLYYLAALRRDADPESSWRDFVAFDELAPLAASQRASDERLIAFCEALDVATLDAVVRLPRGQGRVQRDRVGHVLQHLFMHQAHHRGQAHAMTSGTRVAPPQLDEFLLPSEAHLRTAEMAALGWDEEAIYGDPP
jgi:uncharacterized damage-inducible protein DinB